MTDANAFFDLSTFDSNGIIGMNLYDWIWSMFDEIKFVISSIIFEKDVLIDFEFMSSAGTICAK